MHRYLQILTLLGVVIMGLSCNTPVTRDKLSSMGLVESVIGRDEIHKAMDIVNHLIKAKNMSPIMCGWECHDFSDTQTYYFLTQPDGLPHQTIAQASKENKAIFISSSWRSICDQTFSLSEDDSTLRIDALVFVLLHETGHLLNRKQYTTVEGSGIELDSLLFKSRNSMYDEINADFFAADVVKTNPGIEAKELMQKVEELYLKVDYHFDRKYGVHGSPLSMMLSEPAKRYSDLSYSHPNLNLRMHLISFLIHPTPEKIAELKAIREERLMYVGTNTFTPDVMDHLTYLKLLPAADSIVK